MKSLKFFNIETMMLIILFFVPGFISIKVYDLLVPNEKRDFSKSFLEAISYSCINFALLFPVSILIHQDGFYNNYQFWYFFLIFLVICIFPIIWPVLLKRLLYSKFLQGKIVHPLPKAWDYIFDQEKSFWVLIHLKNGNLIGGVYKKGSFASSFPNEQDLYLVEVWKVSKKGEFLSKVEQTGGLLIKDEEIEYMEFFKANIKETKIKKGNKNG